MEFQKKPFLIGRYRSVNYAFKGALKLITTEHSIILQFIIAVIMTLLGFYFEISKAEWLFQTFSIGLIMSIEGLNTAIEKMADFIQPEFDERIGFIKDIAAGAVFIAALTAIIIGFIIYLPKFY